VKSEAQIFKALGDATRLRILALLLDGELCVCELVAALELPQSTVSRHLSYLRNSGWLQDRRKGVWMYYRLSEDKDSLVEALVPALKQMLSGHPQNAVARQRLNAFHDRQNGQAC